MAGLLTSDGWRCLSSGVLFTLLGMAVGSFCNVLYHRLPLRESVVLGRSHCPCCNHTLGARDLVPVFSFLMLRGRCRYCHERIPWRYPLVELGSGLLAGGAGAIAGWFGGLGALAVCVLAATAVGRRVSARRAAPETDAGFTLVEVLVAIAILVVAVLPALDGIAAARQAGLATQRRSLVIGLARARIGQIAAAVGASSIAAADRSGWRVPTDGLGAFGEASLQTYLIETAVDNPYPVPGTGDSLRRISVTVSCPACKANFGIPVRPVTLTAVLRGGPG